MSMSDELNQLGDLHQRGVLSAEEFAQAKARVIGQAEVRPIAAPWLGINKLRRSQGDRWLGGVCGGLFRATGIDTWAWRLLFALLLLCAGTGVLVYVLMWFFVPLEAAGESNLHLRAS